MEALVHALHALVPVAWTLAAAAYAWVFLKADADAERVARPLSRLAAGVHVLAFGAVAATGTPPVASAVGLVSASALAMGLVYLWLERRIGSRSSGVFPVTLVALMATVASAAGDPLVPVSEALRSWKIAAHVGGAILGYAGLLQGALFGVLYLLQRRAMRQRRFGLLWERLPALELLDSLCWRSLLAGFVFLTLTIGFGHASRAAAGLQGVYWDPKIIATNLLWLLVGLVVLGRATDRVRPMIAAVASVLFFGIALVNMLAVDPVSGFHGAF